MVSPSLYRSVSAPPVRARGLFRERNVHFYEATRRGRIDRRDNSLNVAPKDAQLRVADDDNGKLSACKILLIAEVLVRGHKHFKARRFRDVEQVPVDQSIPSRSLASVTM